MYRAGIRHRIVMTSIKRSASEENSNEEYYAAPFLTDKEQKYRQ
jgi:hypothetical protein